MIPDGDAPSKGQDALSVLIRNRASDQFGEARNWYSRISRERAEEFVVGKIVENLSRTLSNGIMELTVESISRTPEYADALRNRRREIVLNLREKLPTFNPYVIFVPKIGAIELGKKQYTFRVQTEIEAHGVKVTISDNHIDNLSVDNLTATIELSIVNGVEVRLGTIRRQMKISDNSVVQETSETLDSQRAVLKPPTQPSDAGIKFCTKCGGEIPANATFCRKCGARQHGTDNSQT